MNSSPQDGERAGPSPRRLPPGELVAKLERLGQQRPPPPAGRGVVLLVLGVVVVAGTVYTFVAGGPVSRRMAQRQDGPAASAPDAVVTPAAPTPPGTPAPAPTPAPVSVPSSAASEAPTVSVDSAEALAQAVRGAPPERRADLRRVALETYVQLVQLPAHRRAALESALRLANEAVPEEGAAWERLAEGAVAALEAPADAHLGLLFLATLRERGGAPARAALERLVADERRPLEQRTAAARALPAEARAPLLARLESRPRTHPEILRALR